MNLNIFLLKREQNFNSSTNQTGGFFYVKKTYLFIESLRAT